MSRISTIIGFFGTVCLTILNALQTQTQEQKQKQEQEQKELDEFEKERRDIHYSRKCLYFASLEYFQDKKKSYVMEMTI